MSLSPGARLGQYEVVGALGAGGMGEVYRATDARLKRQVAIKILPASLAADGDRLTRFQREAQVLASLNHPNIAAIYGLESGPTGQEAEAPFLVMELVEGEDLSQRIARGAIPLDEAVSLARQVTEALEAAHEQGIIHRDLKPANIKVRADGTVKVLDFGLAKAMEPAGAMSASASISPTLTSPAMTQAGIILGTAAYMSPEQARGTAVDRRADLWAFGAVLWEMLTGKTLFEGPTVSDTLASVLTTNPDWNALPTTVPPAIRRLLRHCLEKDRKRRLDSAAAARLELDETVTESGTQPSVSVGRRPSISWVALTLTALAALIAGMAVDRALTTARSEPREATRLSMSVAPADQIVSTTRTIPRPSRTALAVSPDGRTVVFAGSRGTTRQLFRRRLDESVATPLSGTEGAGNPIMSPDGEWVAFVAGAKLRKVPTVGGPAVDICDLGAVTLIWGADWGDNGTIAFSTGSAIMRVGSTGGIPQELVKSDAAQTVLPHWLPGERALLYTVSASLGDYSGARVLVRRVDGGEPGVVVEGGTDARYVQSGHLLYMKSGALIGVPFDPDALRTTGTAVTLMEDVMQALNSSSSNTTGAGQIAVSAAGTLAYLRGGVGQEAPTQILWVDRRGVETPLKEPPGGIYNVRLSPDGRRVAYAKTRPGSSSRDIWVYDLERNVSSRLTFGDPYRAPVWAPDGKSLIFGTFNRDALYRLTTGGPGTPERLTPADQREVTASSMSTSGLLAYVVGVPGEIWTLPLSGDRKPELFLKGPYALSHPAISPDGRRMAYVSNETGREEVYVQPYPGPGDKVRLSVDGGSEPVWARSGRELFYTQGPLRADDVNVTTLAVSFGNDGLAVGGPRALFSGPYRTLTPISAYDVSADGQRFITTKSESREAPTTDIEIVLNFTDELKRRVPAGK